MRISIGIVDYQMGNLRSVQKAIERLGFEANVSSHPTELDRATHLVLPGVGAFGDAIAELEGRNLVSFLRDWTTMDRPFLGICLGLQLLFDRSFEGGEHQGLGILRGDVRRFDFSSETEPITTTMSAPLGTSTALLEGETRVAPALKVPHMGWNQVTSSRPNDPMLQHISGDPYVYFVHSYCAVPTDPSVVWLTCDYGIPFCAGVRQGQTLATQFHPEKSQRDGLTLIRNFIETTQSPQR